MKYGLIGEHLGHSYSAEIHAALGNPDYELRELTPAEVEPFLKHREFLGINVTIPYKETVIPFLDSISDRAERIGAVNTIVCREGKLFGDNTDYAGMKALMERMGIGPVRKALVLGTGGTSKTAHAVLERAGCGRILAVSRREGEGTITYDQACRMHADADLIVNATPCGMYPDDEGIPVLAERFPKLKAIADAVYHPLRTNLVLAGQKRGIPAEGGLYMLAAQAVYAHGLFFDQRIGTDLIEKAFREVRMQKQNLVLIGMPSCGKTTVGRILAERSGKTLVDTDRILTERIGMPIADFFACRGEEAFREEETKVIRECSRMDGIILATGGGAVLKEENISALRRNGKLVFLDRSLDRLVCSDDRPLSSSPEQLARIYRERMPVYRSAADCAVPADEEPDRVAERIWKEFQE